jgi:hypothetical protein
MIIAVITTGDTIVVTAGTAAKLWSHKEGGEESQKPKAISASFLFFPLGRIGEAAQHEHRTFLDCFLFGEGVCCNETGFIAGASGLWETKQNAWQRQVWRGGFSS